ncbi:cytochrome c1 [Cereibacter azotoformans]|uniref:Cytochrome c1 n=2 Tax=Cereibacter TaxID=1653176 RepID=A0A2T5K8M1_9RHOB|nr:cytochrome c1 [Cereibacter azotoformans]AXQ94822.1 cytochrome c1 [Cereibacter sphaeroides]MBO4170314.1 cytochrome c1 [Cereibacter azotoformans]PTR18771.1 ubiquinol-cytochrome c reductase cytochrome c1 subunit [Cereibacter azotoformans]UIJ30394.1 cytochrome c1 [Cereibacter azotoformans]ULB11047.1 cytochrome c1 [Cereibacter azotoformans]
MIRKLTLTAVTALALSGGAAMAAGGAGHIEDVDFVFEGPFGTFDQHQLQRGLQVYTEVCSACHGLKYVPIRSLSDKGGPELPEDQVRAYATQFTVVDAETGEDRDGAPTDHFPVSQLENAPDLSLMTKSRAGFHGPMGTGLSQLFNGMGGAEYMFSILTGYPDEPPKCAIDNEPDGYYYNRVFQNGAVPDSCKDANGVKTVAGSWIAMPPPLMDDLVEYSDGHDASVHAMAEDVSAFLMWTAEPKMMARKQAGFTAVMFLTVLSVLLYLTNKRLWAGVKGKKKTEA